MHRFSKSFKNWQIQPGKQRINIMVGNSLIILVTRVFMIIFIKSFLQTDKNPWNPDNSKTKINFIINQRKY